MAEPLLVRGRGPRDWVVYAQQMLNEALSGGMHIDVPENGTFDEEFEGEVKGFQTRVGIDVDGKIGPDTWDALKRAVEAKRAATPGDEGEPDAPRQRGGPAEGFTRITLEGGEHIDLETSEVVGMYVDNNIVNFEIQPVPVTLEIDNQPLTLYYASGAELHLPTLSTIGDGYDDGAYICYVSSGYLVATCTRSFQPMYNAFTTPRLHWLKNALHDKVRELAAQQLEVIEVGAAFADIIALYGSLDNTVGFVNLSATGRLPGG